jgi:hypothetical protein
MQMLDFKMIENQTCSKPLCVGYNIASATGYVLDGKWFAKRRFRGLFTG